MTGRRRLALVGFVALLAFALLRLGPIELRLDDPEALARVARRRGVTATRCEPLAVELRPGETAQVVLRVVDHRGAR